MLTDLMCEVGAVMWIFSLLYVVCGTLKLAVINFFVLARKRLASVLVCVVVVSERRLLVEAVLCLDRAERPEWPRLCYIIVR